MKLLIRVRKLSPARWSISAADPQPLQLCHLHHGMRRRVASEWLQCNTVSEVGTQENPGSNLQLDAIRWFPRKIRAKIGKDDGQSLGGYDP